MNIRKPAVAGQFYPRDPRRLLKEIERLVEPNLQKQKAVAVVSPHAGYMYSGQVAGQVFSQVEIPKQVIILGPNHTGQGADASIMNEGIWEMPMGSVEIDQQLADYILQNSNLIEPDISAHYSEHSLEVQVPFLQYFQPQLKIVPIVLGGYNFDMCQSVAHAISAAIAEQADDVLIVASTDLTHYQPQDIANQKDSKVIEKIEAMDAKGLFDIVVRERISMCGFLPVTTTLLAANEMGAKGAGLVKYMTSGDVSGDFSYVVGYAGMVIH